MHIEYSYGVSPLDVRLGSDSEGAFVVVAVPYYIEGYILAESKDALFRALAPMCNCVDTENRCHHLCESCPDPDCRAAAIETITVRMADGTHHHGCSGFTCQACTTAAELRHNSETWTTSLCAQSANLGNPCTRAQIFMALMSHASIQATLS